VSYIQFQQKCKACGESWNAAFGIVGTTQIAAPPKVCPHCGSDQLTKLADGWAPQNIKTRCGLCDQEFEGSHDCLVLPTLSELEAACISAAVYVTSCDHYCCGDTKFVCRAKNLAEHMSDPACELFHHLPVNQKLAAQVKVAEELIQLLRGHQIGSTWPFVGLIAKWESTSLDKAPDSEVGCTCDLKKSRRTTHLASCAIVIKEKQ
jgi:hypothetical protein